MLRGEATRLLASSNHATVAGQREAEHRLADRLRDTTSWKCELQAELDRNKAETNRLVNVRLELRRHRSREYYY